MLSGDFSVSILVVMEERLTTICRTLLRQVKIVSILVVMDRQETCFSSLDVCECGVSILVVMDRQETVILLSQIGKEMSQSLL